MRIFLCIVTFAATIALATSCSGASGKTIHGSLSLSDKDERWRHGQDCQGTGGYSDIDEGAQVVVKDEAGKVIATSDLGPGKGKDLLRALAEEAGTTPTPSSIDSSSISNLFVTCVFPFTVKVPAAKFYAIEVSHRGQLSFSREELNDRNWEVSLTLGP